MLTAPVNAVKLITHWLQIRLAKNTFPAGLSRPGNFKF